MEFHEICLTTVRFKHCMLTLIPSNLSNSSAGLFESECVSNPWYLKTILNIYSFTLFTCCIFMVSMFCSDNWCDRKTKCGPCRPVRSPIHEYLWEVDTPTRFYYFIVQCDRGHICVYHCQVWYFAPRNVIWYPAANIKHL